MVAALAGGLLASLPPVAAAHQSRVLLDVPYLTQTPALCGGAAVAMVLRYWGAQAVFPQDFAPLVVAREGGIPAHVLAEAVRARRWRADVIAVAHGGPRQRLQQEIDQGRPVIALIEVSPRTFHYVVIVALTADEVIVHDPARAPFMVSPWVDFDRAWRASDRWALRILPPMGVGETTRALAPVSRATGTVCEQLVAHAVTVALAGRSDDAERALVSATRVCPDEAAAWRELAGWRFTQSRWQEAAALATTALARAPDDNYTRHLLAASRFLAGDLLGALAAWVPLGEPTVDVVAVHGLERTPHPLVVGATGLQPRQLLTPQRFGRAQRRVRALPVVAASRLILEPDMAGQASVTAAVVERSVAPGGWLAVGRIAARAAVTDTVDVEMAGAFRRAELLRMVWRWATPRPRLAATLTAPAPLGAPGIVVLDIAAESQTYAGGLRESRRRAALSWSDWGSHRLWWQGGLAVDRLDGRRYVSAAVGVDLRLAGDRLAIGTQLAAWHPRAGAPAFSTGRLTAALRTTTSDEEAAWHLWTSLDVASDGAPRAVWAGAGTGEARAGRLRAHQLVRDQVVSGSVFGRRLAAATVEHRRPVGHRWTTALGVVAFVDAAQAWRGPQATRLEVDVGAGLSVRGAGVPGGVRFDVARGLRRGGWRASLAWGRAWPD